MFNAIFNLIWVIFVAVSFIGRRQWSTRIKPPTCRKSLTNFITYYCIVYTSPWAGIVLTPLVMIGTYCTGSCKSNHHTTTTMKKEYACAFWYKLCDRMVVGFTTTWAIIPTITKVVSLNPSNGDVCSIQHYVIRFVNDLLQVGNFLKFSPPMKLVI